MPASIFNGSAVKLLKNLLRFKDGTEIITNDSDDPTAVAKSAPQGSLYIRSGTGDVYIKQDSGSSTNWSQIADATDLANKANTSLNNLASTSVNADIIPSASNTRNLGSLAAQYLRQYIWLLGGSTNTFNGSLTGDTTSGSDLVTNVTGDLQNLLGTAAISGTGIPANTLAFRISSNSFRLVNATTFVPVNATATNTGVALTYTITGGLFCGSVVNLGGASGTVFVGSGRAVGSSTGALSLSSGETDISASGSSGSVTITSGNVTNGSAASSVSSGAVNLTTGVSWSAAPTGAVNISTGLNVGTGSTGNISLSTGVPLGGGTRGSVSATANSITLTSTVGGVTLAPASGQTVSVSSRRITNLSDPTTSSDAATKSYVDAIAQGVKAKQAVATATTADITLSGEQTIDGVLTSSSRVLVKDQTLATQNGIYISAVGAWTRAADFDSLTPVDEINGAIVGISGGTTQAGQVWVNTGGVTGIGVSNINFVYFNSVSALNGGDGISIGGLTVSVDHDGEGLTFSSAQLALELDGSTLSKSATGLKVADLGISNAQVSNSAAIAYSKLALNDSIVNADINSAAAIAYSKLALTNSIVNADINSAAAIAYSKLALNDSIVNADINSAAAIAYSKLALTNSIVNADIDSTAAIAYSKLAALTTNRALTSDGSGFVSASSVTSTELNYLSGVTSAIQTQLDSKVGTATSPQSTSFTASKSINYLVDSSGGAVTVTLPPASGGGWVRIIDSGAASETNNIVVDGDGSETINGAATYTIDSNRQAVFLLSTGSAWVVA